MSLDPSELDPSALDTREVKIRRPEPVKYEDGIETNIYDIAEQICSVPPQYPCMIQLIMDHEIPDSDDLDDVEFDLLKAFVLACLQILFGKNFNPIQMSELEKDKINEYIHSIGYHMITNIEETEKSIKMTMSFQRYKDYEKTFKKNPFEHLKKYM